MKELHQENNSSASMLADIDKSSLKVSFYVFFASGGISRYTHRLALSMNKLLEARVEVLCSPEYAWKESTGYATWPGLKALSNKISFIRRMNFLNAQFVNPSRAIKRAKTSGSDIIHFSNINPLSFPLWKSAINKSGIKNVITVHDVRRRKGILNKNWESRQLKQIYRNADALFVHSHYQADELVNYAQVDKKRIHVVPHGPYEHSVPTASPEDTRSQLGVKKGHKVALFFGQVRDDKNLDAFIKALSQCTNDTHLVVAGRSGGRHRAIEFYRQLAEECGISERITFIPRFVTDEEVSNYFIAADWVALPYKNSFTSQSGVLNVAAHYSRPVLVSSSPVIRETVMDCDIGVACSGDTIDSLVEGILQINNRINDGHKHKFEEYLLRYSWEENVKKTLEVYTSLFEK